MLKSDKTRGLILEAAANLIARSGLRALTVRDLAHEAELSTGAITRYFPKSETIFPAVLAHIFSIGPFDSVEVDPLARLIDIVRINFEELLLRRPHYYRVIGLSYFYVGIDPVITRMHRRDLELVTRHRREIVAEVIAQHSLNLTSKAQDEFTADYIQLSEGAMLHCSLISSRARKAAFARDFARRLEQNLRLRLGI